jgi:hypothetical protein
MKKNMYRPVLMSLAIAALLISALTATIYPAHAAPRRGWPLIPRGERGSVSDA